MSTLFACPLQLASESETAALTPSCLPLKDRDPRRGWPRDTVDTNKKQAYLTRRNLQPVYLFEHSTSP